MDLSRAFSPDPLPQPEVFAIFAYLVAHNIARSEISAYKEFTKWLLDNNLFSALARSSINFLYRRLLITRILEDVSSSSYSFQWEYTLPRSHPDEYLSLL